MFVVLAIFFGSLGVMYLSFVMMGFGSWFVGRIIYSGTDPTTHILKQAAFNLLSVTGFLLLFGGGISYLSFWYLQEYEMLSLLGVYSLAGALILALTVWLSRRFS